MTARNYLTVVAIVGGLFGIGFTLIPAALLAIYGVTANASHAHMAQIFGVTLVGFSVLNWMARGLSAQEEGLRAILMGNLVSDGLAFLVTLIAQATGRSGANSMGWSTVVLYLLFTAGAAYLLFMPQARSVARAGR
jgi:hypothetical protein